MEGSITPGGAPMKIRIRDLSKRFGSLTAIDNVSIEIPKGQFFVIVGPSGCGKTTLLRILGGLEVASAGQVNYPAHALTAASEDELTRYRREHVGFVFQFYNLIPSLTARENVALVTDLVSGSMTPDEALGLVGLGQRLDHFPAQLSGGEQQRVAIARALVNDPHIILADEPTGNLDPDLSLDIMNVFREINARGTTVLVATHDREMVRRVRKKTAMLKNGRILVEDALCRF